MAKNNQKKEKALRNLENARKYRKKSSFGRNRFGRKPNPQAAAPSSESSEQ